MSDLRDILVEHLGCYQTHTDECGIHSMRSHRMAWPCEVLGGLEQAIEDWAEAEAEKPKPVTWHLATCKACNMTQPFKDRGECNRWAYEHGNMHHHIALAAFPEHLDEKGIPTMEIRTEERTA